MKKIKKSVDLSFLKRITEGDEDLLISFVNNYLKQSDQLLEIIKEAYENNDWKALAENAHKFKSSAKIIGNYNLFENLAKLEEYSLEGNEIESKVLLETIESIKNNSEIELRQEFHY